MTDFGKRKDGQAYPKDNSSKKPSSNQTKEPEKHSGVDKSRLNKIKEAKKKPKKSLDDIINEEVEKRLDKLHDDEDAYDDFLDEVGDMNQLLDDYSYSTILKESDPIAYRTGLNDYVDSVVRDEEHEIRKQAEDEVYNNLEDYGLTEDDYQDDPFYEAVDKKYDELYEERIDELHDDTSSYDNVLDENPDPDMGGSYSSILKEIDPVAYRTGKNDWVDGERDRVRDEVTDEIDEEASLKSGKFEE